MHIKFIYPKGVVDSKKEKIVTRVCNALKEQIELPNAIEIQFQEMNPSSYAETELDRKRIVLNLSLSANDILIPLVHELIHLNQIHTGQLAISKTGMYIWEGTVYNVNPARMLYSDYSKLPWELDVAKKQRKLLENLLKN